MSTKNKQSANYGKSIVAFKDRRNLKHFSLWRNVDNKVQISGRVINLVKDVFSSVNNTVSDDHANGPVFHTYITPIYDVDSNTLISYNGNGKGLKIQFSIFTSVDFKLSDSNVMIYISEHGNGYKAGEIITCQKGIFLRTSANGDSSTLKISSVF